MDPFDSRKQQMSAKDQGPVSGRPAWIVPAVLVAVLTLLVGGGYYLWDRVAQEETAGAGINPTDCITIEESSSFSRRGRSGGGGSPEPVPVDCSSPEARYTVLGERPQQGGIPYSEREVLCTDFAGATTELPTDGLEGPVLCLGPVGVDTSASINDITPDECLVRDGDGEDDVDGSDDDPRRADCTEPGAMRVVAVLRGATELDYRVRDQIADCADAGAGEATEAFSWGLEEQELMDHEKAVCLVPAGTAS